METINSEVAQLINFLSNSEHYKIEITDNGIYIHNPQFIFIPYSTIKKIEHREYSVDIWLHQKVVFTFMTRIPMVMTTILT